MTKIENSSQKTIQKIKEAKATHHRIQTFAKRMDDYGIDVIVGLVPGAGDLVIGAISTGYILYHGFLIELPSEYIFKIIVYQAADLLLGSIPIIGDIGDYFYKANKKSAYLFKKHLDTLIEEAINSGELIVEK